HLRAGVLAGAQGLGREHVGYGFLEGGADILDWDGVLSHLPGGFGTFDEARDGGFQTGEGEVVAGVLRAHHAAWEGDGLAVALAGESVNNRPARVAEPEEAGDLVIGLAGGIVEGAAELRHGLAHP